eukprot:2289583-Prymnesium_polylepis.1
MRTWRGERAPPTRPRTRYPVRPPVVRGGWWRATSDLGNGQCVTGAQCGSRSVSVMGKSCIAGRGAAERGAAVGRGTARRLTHSIHRGRSSSCGADGRDCAGRPHADDCTGHGRPAGVDSSEWAR